MRVLVVEDEPKAGSYLQKGLVESGFVVDLAVTGIEVSHQPTKQQEKQMRRFKCARHAQRFLSAHFPINDHLRVRLSCATASAYREVRQYAFSIWSEASCTDGFNNAKNGDRFGVNSTEKINLTFFSQQVDSTLASIGVRPCWAHQKKARCKAGLNLYQK